MSRHTKREGMEEGGEIDTKCDIGGSTGGLKGAKKVFLII